MLLLFQKHILFFTFISSPQHKNFFLKIDTYHFPSFISKLESIGENLNVGGSFQFVTSVCRNIESNVVTFQQSHLGFCIFVSKWKFFRNHKINFDAAR